MTPQWRFLVFLLMSWTYLTSAGNEEFDTAQTWSNVAPTVTATVPSSRSFFSSKLDYNNKWLPVGRGDPLKKDPTYDYSPPVIDHRTHFWDDRSSKSKGNKNEILLLGVSSKRPYNQKFIPSPSHIPTIMLPPPIQQMQIHNYKSENNLIRQSAAMNRIWPDKQTDSQSDGSHIYASIVRPNSSPMQQHAGQSKKSWLQDLLIKEVAKPTSSPNFQMESVPILKLGDFTQHRTTTTFESATDAAQPYFVPTIQPTLRDSIKDNKLIVFAEVKPSIKPVHFIIEGHSRVKTYGQGTPERDPKIIEVKSVQNPVINRVVSEDENGVKFDVKHLHTKTKNDSVVETKSNNSTMAGLLSLLDLSFGDYLDDSLEPVNATKNEIKAL